MFKYVFRNVKEPQIRTIRYITEKLKRRNSMFVRWRQQLILIIAYTYFSITDVGSTEYH